MVNSGFGNAITRVGRDCAAADPEQDDHEKEFSISQKKD